MPNKLIRCGIHLEMQKHGKQPDPTRPDVRSQIQSATVAEAAEMEGIVRLGVELAFAENRALFAIQRLFDETDYSGNLPPVAMPEPNQYLFGGKLPRLIMSHAEYLEAYGLVQRVSHRGKSEYNSGARKSALDALRTLSTENFLIVYDRKYKKDAMGIRPNPDHVEVVAPLITLEETRGKLTITPHPIMVDQINDYFFWKPANLYTEDVLDEKSKTQALFVEYLNYLYEINRRTKGARSEYIVKIQQESMANVLHMRSLLDARKKAQIRKRLTRLYNHGMWLGYLNKFEIDVPGTTVQKLDCLYLDGDWFKQMRASLPKDGAESP